MLILETLINEIKKIVETKARNSQKKYSALDLNFKIMPEDLHLNELYASRKLCSYDYLKKFMLLGKNHLLDHYADLRQIFPVVENLLSIELLCDRFEKLVAAETIKGIHEDLFLYLFDCISERDCHQIQQRYNCILIQLTEQYKIFKEKKPLFFHWTTKLFVFLFRTFNINLGLFQESLFWSKIEVEVNAMDRILKNICIDLSLTTKERLDSSLDSVVETLESSPIVPCYVAKMVGLSTEKIQKIKVDAWLAANPDSTDKNELVILMDRKTSSHLEKNTSQAAKIKAKAPSMMLFENKQATSLYAAHQATDSTRRLSF